MRKIDLLEMSGGSGEMNGPPQEGCNQDRGSGRLSLGRVRGSLRGGTNVDLGLSLFASAAQVRSTCARPCDVVSGGVNAPPFPAERGPGSPIVESCCISEQLDFAITTGSPVARSFRAATSSALTAYESASPGSADGG